MYRTEVGYAGGTTPSPTYRNIGDHAEAVQIHYDPQQLSLETLLDMFWAGHDPSFTKASQYRAELWTRTSAELAIAKRSAQEIEAREGITVATRVLHDPVFYSAEAYHQKWRLRRRESLFTALLERYDTEADLLASTAAAKLNAYAGGHWQPSTHDIAALGLSSFFGEGGRKLVGAGS